MVDEPDYHERSVRRRGLFCGVEEGKLVPGVNVLAVQAHNQFLSSSDFIFIPELLVTIDPQP